jgi:hypothetical protein
MKFLLIALLALAHALKADDTNLLLEEIDLTRQLIALYEEKINLIQSTP